MSKFLEQLGRLVAENEQLSNLVLGAKRDIKGVLSAPGRAIGAGAKMAGRAVENVGEFAEDVAGFVADNAPRLEVGSGDSEIEINPLGALARGAETYADNVSTLGGALSDSDMIDDLSGQSALDRMDRRIDNISSDGITQRERFLKRKAEVEARQGKAGEPQSFDDMLSKTFADLSEEEKEAFRERRAKRRSDPGYQKRVAGVKEDFERRAAERAARKAQQAGGGEESFEDFDPTGEEYDSAFDGSADSQGRSAYAPSEVETRTAKQPVADSEGPLAAQGSEPDPPKAVPDAPDDQAEALFMSVLGGPFDPNSSIERGKLAQIKENLVREEYQGLSPNQFALKMYREAA